MKELVLIGTAIAVAFSGYIRKGSRSWLSRHGEESCPKIAVVCDPATLLEDDPRALIQAVDAYLRQPTGDRLSRAWECFLVTDSRLAELKRKVAVTVGGARAEAELDRLDLQTLRDREMERFTGAQRRFQGALAACDALSDSIESGEGLQKAAAILAHGSERVDRARAN